MACFAVTVGQAYFGDLDFDPLMSLGGFFHTDNRFALKIPYCFENSPFLCVGSNIGHKSPLTCPLGIPSRCHLRQNVQNRAEHSGCSSWDTGTSSNPVCFSLLTALEETRDDENLLDNFITFFVAG